MESNLEKKYVALEPKIIRQIQNDEQNCEESKKDQRDVELTYKGEKEYMIRAVSIEKQVKDNLNN